MATGIAIISAVSFHRYIRKKDIPTFITTLQQIDKVLDKKINAPREDPKIAELKE